MKKLVILTAALALLSVPAAFAGNSAGCGLGSIIFEGQSGVVMNVLAATFNGTSGNQTFGMTTGTSNCDASDTVMNEMVQEHFVAMNYDNLSGEMAQGHGQYVTAMADLMGCPAATQGTFARMSQEKYGELFSAPEMDAKRWIVGLKAVMAQDATLASACTRIS